MIRLKTVAVLMLLALWVPVTSHAALEQAGLIHAAQSHHEDHHDAADGLCIKTSTHVQTPEPSSALTDGPWARPNYWLPSLAVVDRSVTEASGPAPPGVAPPELPQTWHFVSRNALSARAPSLTS